MRNYLAKIELIEDYLSMSSGAIAEDIFEKWFRCNFQGESIHKQKADMDYKGIDFIDEKGIKYQIKGSKGKTFTFNCSIDDLGDHLRADKYVFIQLTNTCAYIEPIYSSEVILEKAKPSFQYKDSCFVWSKDLQQYELKI